MPGACRPGPSGEAMRSDARCSVGKASRRRAAWPDPGDVDLLDSLDGVGGVAGEDVGQAGCQAAAGGQGDAGLSGGVVKVEEAADGAGVVAGSGGGDTGLYRPFENCPFGRTADG